MRIKQVQREAIDLSGTTKAEFIGMMDVFLTSTIINANATTPKAKRTKAESDAIDHIKKAAAQLRTMNFKIDKSSCSDTQVVAFSTDTPQMYRYDMTVPGLDKLYMSLSKVNGRVFEPGNIEVLANASCSIEDAKDFLGD